ncbi:thioredoxin [Lachnospiraceae bacterium]|jgi:thioredoxin-related protein|nr:thioredoxin family protein [uncultured Schaedlerella sp.]NBI60834.1 thioredoxin [Lachnospiraceae bacterium]
MDEKKHSSADFNNFIKFVSFLPFLGLSSSVMGVLFFILNKRQWSLTRVIYILSPFITYVIIYAIITIVIKTKYALLIPFIIKSLKKLFIFMLILLIGLNIAFYKLNSIKYTNIPLSNLELVGRKIAQEDKLQKYYVIYGSQNCSFCNQMEEVYQEGFLKKPQKYIYYVDLSYEIIDSVKNINKLPLLVCYQNNQELDRLEGYVPLEKLISFLEK